MLFRGRYFYAQKLGFALLFNGRHGIMLLSYVLISAFLGRNVNSAYETSPSRSSWRWCSVPEVRR